MKENGDETFEDNEVAETELNAIEQVQIEKMKSEEKDLQTNNSIVISIFLRVVVYLCVFLFIFYSCTKEKSPSKVSYNSNTITYSESDSAKKTQKEAIGKIKANAEKDGFTFFDSGYTFDCCFSAAKDYLLKNYGESVYDTSCLCGMISLSKYDFMGYTQNGKYFYMTIDHDTNSTLGVWKVTSCTVDSLK